MAPERILIDLDTTPVSIEERLTDHCAALSALIARARPLLPPVLGDELTDALIDLRILIEEQVIAELDDLRDRAGWGDVLKIRMVCGPSPSGPDHQWTGADGAEAEGIEWCTVCGITRQAAA